MTTLQYEEAFIKGQEARTDDLGTRAPYITEKQAFINASSTKKHKDLLKDAHDNPRTHSEGYGKNGKAYVSFPPPKGVMEYAGYVKKWVDNYMRLEDKSDVPDNCRPPTYLQDIAKRENLLRKWGLNDNWCDKYLAKYRDEKYLHKHSAPESAYAISALERTVSTLISGAATFRMVSKLDCSSDASAEGEYSQSHSGSDVSSRAPEAPPAHYSWILANMRAAPDAGLAATLKTDAAAGAAVRGLQP